MKILIIEDDEAMRETLKDLLEVAGHEVLAAEDGVQGVALAAQGPDFIFCDVDMPNLNGHGALAEIRKLPRGGDVPFVFLTGRSDRSELRTGMGLGADDYITKPYSADDIYGAIEARTKRQGSLQEKIQSLSRQQEREINAQWSHELLTPLNAVLGSLDLLESDADTIDRAELKEMLALIREGAERQERLARKLINYFSLQQVVAAARPHGRCAADAAIARGASEAMKLKKRDADLTVSAEPAEVTVAEQWLALAVGEVIENAASFSKPGRPIVVIGKKAGGRYRLTITDEGSGMTAEQRAQVGAFAQFDRKRHEQQGLGLGLTIARLVAKLAGGTLQLDAGPGDQGLRVEFDLPLAGS
jgi:two-component system sensor histidine kinase/response regulator